MNGILTVDKPAGWTSHDVVARVRRLAQTRRVGHAGTLDPMATGVLVVLIGRATRAAEFAEAPGEGLSGAHPLRHDHGYAGHRGEAALQRRSGARSAEIEAVLPRFRGEIEQIPPMYSAVKLNGRKLYEIARSGGEVSAPPGAWP